MVVIAIIAILLSIVVPAVQGARVKTVEAAVVREINGLASSIAIFQSRFGDAPPSQFSIYLTQAGWNGDPAAMAAVRSLWPQFDFSMGAGPGVAYPAFWQQVAAAQPTKKAVIFNSAEALLFFLGGVIDQPGANQPPHGFAKDPLHPFAPMSQNPSREGPFFEFNDINRIKDIDGNGLNEWYDLIPNQTKPYLYYSAYAGRGYDLAEIDGNGSSIGIYSLQGAFICDAPHDIYRTAKAPLFPPATPQSGTAGTSADPTLATAYKSQTFQIISPGYDMEYGSGGVFNPALKNAGLKGYDTASGNAPLDPDTRQYDNLTNFHPGRLNP